MTPFPNIVHAVRGWCCAHGLKFLTATVHTPGWASCRVEVSKDVCLVGSGETNEEVLATLDRSLAKHRGLVAEKRREAFRLVVGGKV